MKISKRSLTLILAMVLSLSATAFGTVAYLTDRTNVTNTFTVGGIDITVDESIVDEDGKPTTPDHDLDGDGKPDVEIEVDPEGTITITPIDPETGDPIVIDPSNPVLPDLNDDGKPDVEIEVDPEGTITITPINPETGEPTGEPIVIDPTSEPGRTEEGNEYEMVPGKTYTKDPTITVEEGSEECYVRMRVRINELEALRAIQNKYPDVYGPVPDIQLLSQFAQEIDDDNWQLQDYQQVIDENGVTWMEYEFWHKKPNAADSVKINAETAAVKVPPLFEEITVPGWFDNDDLKSIDAFVMDVFGDAIQTESFDNDEEAWDAFDAQHGLSQNNQ